MRTRFVFAVTCLAGLLATYLRSAQWAGQPLRPGPPAQSLAVVHKKSKKSVLPSTQPALPEAGQGRPSPVAQALPWADSVLAALSPRQRLGQLCLVALPADGANAGEWLGRLAEYAVGGVSLAPAELHVQAQALGLAQARTPVPLWAVAGSPADLGLLGLPPLPPPLALGAVADDQLFYQLGRAVASSGRQAGFHQRFVPLVAGQLGDQPARAQAQLAAYARGAEAGQLPVTWGPLPPPTPPAQAVAQVLAGQWCHTDPPGLPALVGALEAALGQGQLTAAQVNAACLRVLQLKEKNGLAKPKPSAPFDQDFSPLALAWRSRQLTEASLTFLQNADGFLPIQSLGPGRVASLAVGGDAAALETMLARYAGVRHFRCPSNPTETGADSLLKVLKKYPTVVVSLHSLSELAPSTVQLVQDLAQRTQVALVFLASPYHLSRLGQVDRFRAVLLAYEDTPQAQELAAQAVFGGVAAPGTLPIALPPFYGLGTGQPLASQQGGPGFRFKYTVPEELGLDRAILQKADSLTGLCVREHAAPGGVVLAAKDGKVFYFKAFGKHTYEGSTAVQPDDLYDLASVTKISTSVAAAMKLTDLGKFNVRSPWASVDKRTRRSNKANLTLADLLTHQSGLKAWIPFWKTRTDAQGRLLASWFSTDSSRTYPHQVADRLYIHRRYAEDSLINEILQSPLSGKKDYVYSDLSYYLYPGMVKRQTGERFEDFLDEQFYQPLGAATLTFNPLRKFPRGRIVPTEYDSLFRRQLLVGTVHDEGAALFGGVSGHAGLFGNANDLAKLMQMYLNQGSYGGRQYLKASTVAEFARCQFCDPADSKKGNQRGLGFDRQRGINAAASASPQSFGHSGFTGTFAWADPANGLLYIFLSNRVYPTRNNSKLSDLNIRTELQEVFYEAIRRADAGQ